MVATTAGSMMAAAAQQASGNQNCELIKPDFISVKDIDKDAAFYFKIAQYIMEVLIMSVGDSGYEIIADLVEGNITPLSWIIDYIAVLIVFVCLTLIALGLLIYFVYKLVSQCCGNKKNKVLNVTQGRLFCEIAFIVLCAVLLVAGLALFMASLVELRAGVEQSQDVVKSTFNGVEVFVDNYGKSMECTLSKEKNKLGAELEKAYKEMTATITKQMNDNFDENVLAKIQTGMNNVLPEITKVEQASSNQALLASAKLAKARIQVALQTIKPLEDSFKDIKKSVTTSFGPVRTQVDKTKSFISNVQTRFGSLIKDLKKEVRLVAGKVDQKFIDANLSSKLSYTFILVIPPVVLPFLIVFCGVVLTMRFCANLVTKSRGCLSKFGGFVVGSGGFVAIFIGIYQFVVAAFFFIYAFAALFLCLALFHSDGIHVLRMVPEPIRNFTINVAPGQSLSIDFVDAMVKCENGIGFFDAIDAGSIMAREKIEKEVGPFKSIDFVKKFLAYDCAPVIDNNRLVYNSLDSLMKQSAASQLSSVKTLMNDLDEQYESLTKLNGQAHRDRVMRDVKRKMRNVVEAMIKSVSFLYSASMDMSPQCFAFLETYHKIGEFLCNNISKPAQGLWVASILCGIGACVVINTLFNATRYLNGKDKPPSDSSESYEEIKSSRESPKRKPKKKHHKPKHSGSKESKKRSRESKERSKENKKKASKSKSKSSESHSKKSHKKKQKQRKPTVLPPAYMNMAEVNGSGSRDHGGYENDNECRNALISINLSSDSSSLSSDLFSDDEQLSQL